MKCIQYITPCYLFIFINIYFLGKWRIGIWERQFCFFMLNTCVRKTCSCITCTCIAFKYYNDYNTCMSLSDWNLFIIKVINCPIHTLQKLFPFVESSKREKQHFLLCIQVLPSIWLYISFNVWLVSSWCNQKTRFNDYF